MRLVALSVPQMLDTWRTTARTCLHAGLGPDEVTWNATGDASMLFGDAITRADVTSPNERVPGSFLSLAGSIACHRDEDRWSLLYTMLWRLTHSEPHLMQVASDPLVNRLVTMHRAVRRAAHKMKAFVRFKAIGNEDNEQFVAWFEPAHRVVERTAPFFVDRFRSMRWSILTPDGCARWDGESLILGAGIEKHEVPDAADALENLWRTYYAGIFNPSRLNRAAMRAEMPMQYWKNLPEASLIEGLARNAPARMTSMIEQTLRPPELLPADLDAIEETPAQPETRNGTSWHAVYDPGWREARCRIEVTELRAPRGILRGETRILSGVAGWTDPTLLAPGVFYPDSATTAESRLRYYASLLPMVEVDATYYALPSRETSMRWVERTPADFVFNIKAHSLMTGHPTNPARLPEWLRDELPLRLRVAANVYSHHFTSEILDEVWRRFLDALVPLREAGKLGAVMLQFPKWFTPSREAARELAVARERLGDCPATVELRHRDWFSDRLLPRTFRLLRALKFSYVAVDAPPGMESSVPPVMEVTNPDLAMFRFHGRRESTWEAKNEEVAERYRYLYERQQLQAWLPVIERAVDSAMRVHLTFNNNKWNYAVANALEMNELLLS